MLEAQAVSSSLSRPSLALKFALSAILGAYFFMWPVKQNGVLTVPFDVVVKSFLRNYSGLAEYFCLGILLVGAFTGIKQVAARQRSILSFEAMRTVGFGIGVLLFSSTGPEWLLDPRISKLCWNTLTLSVGIIIPIGAMALHVFTAYGVMEFTGVLCRPLMRLLFRLPGRSAIDNLTSWLGSYSVGLYLTQRMFAEGYYSRREAFTIATCFSTVSIGFVAVVLSTLNIAHLFPWVFGTYFINIYVLAGILVRIWPICHIPDTYIQERPDREEVQDHSLSSAWCAAAGKAARAPSLLQGLGKALFEGLELTSRMLGSVLSVSVISLLLLYYTPLFTVLGYPFLPLVQFFGIPEAQLVASAVAAGIGEMFVPSLMVKDAPEAARFFVATISISQLIFFSSVGPMILSMFRDLPIRASQLIALFVLRTTLLIPIVGVVTIGLKAMGLLG